MKFQATYRVTIYNQDSTVIIGAHEEKDKGGNTKLVQDEARLTCKFSVERGILSDSNKCTIQLYNLAPSTREKIFQDAFQMNPSKWKFVKLEAGYGDDLTEIFMGRILQAYSHRAGGQTDIVTDIQAQALDMFDCYTSYTFEAGTTYKDALQTIVTTSLPNVKLGNVGALEGEFKTRTTFDGNAMDNISKLTGGNAFIDNSQLNVLMANEVIDVPVPVITDDNGLLDTPDRRDANLEVKMLFEPNLIVGQLLEIKSGVSPNFNGQFKVMGFRHDCTISGAEAGSRTTTVNLYIGPFLPGAEEMISGEVQQNFNKVKGFEIAPVNAKRSAQAREVYKHLQQFNGEIPDVRITTNISWRDMIGHSNTNAERKRECTLAILTNCVATAVQLQGIYNAYFKGRPLIITSGWRSKRNNSSCGGKANSKHLSGLAVDFTFGQAKISKKDMYTVQMSWRGYTLNEGTWIHAQINGTKGYANDK